MAYQRIGLTTLIASIQDKIQTRAKLKCYDAVPGNAPSPFYFAEVINTTPANTKTMFRDNFTVWVHAIAEKGNSSVGVYTMIEQLQEALTENIVLPEPFELIMQTDGGVQTIQTDETGEKHAVVTFDFMVCYGFKCKM